jgi:hypothetical protein
LPLFTQDYKGVFALWRKLMKPVGNTLFSVAVAQALVAMWITYCEAKSYYNVQSKLNIETYETEGLTD